MNRPPPKWATVTTLKESLEVTLNFVAHHLCLGASEVWLFFDDPVDEAIEMVSGDDRIRVVRCDSAFWGGAENRPDAHQARQKHNARLAYKDTDCDWIIHLDADEFLQADQSIGSMLQNATHDVLRVAPYEMLHYKRSGIGGNPTHIFRGVLPPTAQGKRIASKAYGEFADILSGGMLSHTAGKFFVRTGITGAELSIHGPFVNGKRDNGVNAPARLLHLHGGDYDEWRDRVVYRIEKGAYLPSHQGKVLRQRGVEATLGGALASLMDKEGENGLKRFHNATCVFGPSKRILRRVGALFKTNLWLDEKRQDQFGDPGLLRNIATDPETGQLEADVVWKDMPLRVVPDNNYTERRIARGSHAEAEEMDVLSDIVRDRKVLFFDVGGNAGVYSLLVAQQAAPDSRIIAFEPNPEMQRRFKRNVALNGFTQIELRPFALGPSFETAHLEFAAEANLGQATLASGQHRNGISVPVVPITSQMPDRDDYELAIMKIDVEGFEADVFSALFKTDRPDGYWPDLILMEHTADEKWGYDLIAALQDQGYRPTAKTEKNTFFEMTGGTGAVLKLA